MAKIKFLYPKTGMSADYCTFFKKEAKRISNFLESKSCSDIEIYSGFYYFYGFFTDAKGRFWYLSCSDVRHFGYEEILFRTAKSYKDFTGGAYRYVQVSELENLEI